MEARALLASITEYPIPGGVTSLGNGLFGITGGPDSNVYFTDTLSNAIGRITPSGVITELPLPPPVIAGSFFQNGLDGITLGADNRLVFTESTQDAIGKITTEGSSTQYPIVSSGTIPLFNTGVDSSGVPLAGGSNDPHWTIISGPSGTFPAPAIVVSSPPGTYASNSNSRWVWENASENAGINSPYTFRETFDLTGENLNTATISGSWAVDNDGMILLNGSTPVGTGTLSLSGYGDNWGSFHSFTITGGFVAGVNTLDFVATDTGNPGGLNVSSLAGTLGSVAGQGPDLIAKASDGSIWWTEDGANAIGEMTPAGVFHEYPVPGATNGGIAGSSLRGIAAGPDGNIWFTNASFPISDVGKITPDGQITQYALPSSTDPYGIVNGPDGNLWVVGYGSNTIDVISTAGTVLHQYPVPVPSGIGGGAQLTDITVGSDENLYFTEQIGNIGEITTSGVVTITPVSTTVATVPGASGPQPLAITSGPDGNIWFTDPWTDSIGVLRIVASALPTNTALRASTAAAVTGQSITFTASVSDLSAGGATPNGGTVTFRDQNGALDQETLVDGMATFTTSSLAVGTHTVTASYGGTPAFAPSTTATAVTVTISGKSLVIHTQPSSTATAGRAFAVQPVVYLLDPNGNLETDDNSTVVTVSLASGIGPLQAKTLSATVVGGIATFTGLADNTAEAIALKFTGDGLTSGPSNPIVVSPAAPFRLKIQTQPSATATAGQPFATQPVIEELDQYGNVETTDSRTVITASLNFGNGPLVGTTTAKLVGGVATFTNLADTAIGTIELGFAGGGLTVGPSNSIVVGVTPAPMTIDEHVLKMRKTNKKGRPVGKPVFVGFSLEYSGTMNPSTAGLAANYRITATTTRRVKKKAVIVHNPVRFTAAYDPSSNSVRLTILGNPKFVQGGQINVINAPPEGVSSAAGALLNASDTEFTILPKAAGITAG